MRAGTPTVGVVLAASLAIAVSTNPQDHGKSCRDENGPVFGEIESSGTQVVVRVKGAMRQMAVDTPLTVRQAKGAVRQGRGVQIRYRHEGVLWSDTYQTTPEGIKLTRCQLPPNLDMA